MASGRTTRSGVVFSPFHAFNIGQSLEPFVKDSVLREAQREEEECDDAEGWPLAYVPFASPLSSPTLSPSSSPSPSPSFSLPPSLPPSVSPSTFPLSPHSHLPSSHPSTLSTIASPCSPSRTTTPPSLGTVARKSITHKQAGYYKRRQKKRAAANDAVTRKIRSSQSKRYQDLDTVKTSFSASKLPAARGAFIGKRFKVTSQHRSLQSYLDEGYKVIPWDGRSTLGLTDSCDRLFAVFVGGPAGDESWPTVVEGARAALSCAKRSIRFSWKQDRRGTFKTVATGLSYGGGQMKPGVLRHTKTNAKALNVLMENPYVRRILGYGNAVFKFYFPKVYQEYANNIDELLKHHTDLERPIQHTVFAAASFNFGPDVVTYEHTDSGNKSNGICPIFCSGNFNPRTGGHLVLSQLKLLVEFPPGRMALLPSATLKHGNVPILPGECRESFTQYAAGGLFRWVKYGFRSWKALSADSDALEREMSSRQTRWKECVSKFSTVLSLHEDRMALFN